MKKYVLIISLIIINFLLIYSKINSTSIKDIKLNLSNDEVGIIFLPLPDSKSLLIKKGDINILYILSYTSNKRLQSAIDVFTDKIDYVISNQDYTIPNSLVLEHAINIEDINIDQHRIVYNQHTFCINESSNCDYSYYLTTPIIISDQVDVLFYEPFLSIDSLANTWLDKYKIIDDYYTVIVLNNEYEVMTFLK